jgi:hypothetical protein
MQLMSESFPSRIYSRLIELESIPVDRFVVLESLANDSAVLAYKHKELVSRS